MGIVVKDTFTYTFGSGNSVVVPAGARTTPIIDESDYRWVDPSIYPSGSLERHDAEYRGIRVHISKTEERAE